MRKNNKTNLLARYCVIVLNLTIEKLFPFSPFQFTKKINEINRMKTITIIENLVFPFNWLFFLFLILFKRSVAEIFY